MTLTSNKEMDPDFVIKTLKLIEDYDNYCEKEEIQEDEDSKMSLLINCLLGLIVFIHEKDKNKKIKYFLNKKILEINELKNIYTRIPEIYQVVEKKQNRIKSIRNKLFNNIPDKKNKKDIRLSSFLSHFRNGVAHSHIEAVIHEEENKIRKEIEFRDEYKGRKTFERTKLSYNDLKVFVKFIANIYIKVSKKTELKG